MYLVSSWNCIRQVLGKAAYLATASREKFKNCVTVLLLKKMLIAFIASTEISILPSTFELNEYK